MAAGPWRRQSPCTRPAKTFAVSSAPEGVPPIGRTRVGLHWGEAIVGNFGGEGRIQYTALGDAMNTAARLESANKQTGTSVLISGAGGRTLRPRYLSPAGPGSAERARSSALDIYEPVPLMPAAERHSFTDLANRASRWRRFAAIAESSGVGGTGEP